jgi:hypothetical protein
MVTLVRAGLVSATPQQVKAGRERMEIVVLRIAEGGRKVLAGTKLNGADRPRRRL